MSETPFVPYRIILIRGGELSPAEDFDTAIVAARQARAMGQDVWQIKQGDDVRGDDRATVIANALETIPSAIPGRPSLAGSNTLLQIINTYDVTFRLGWQMVSAGKL